MITLQDTQRLDSHKVLYWLGLRSYSIRGTPPAGAKAFKIDVRGNLTQVMILGNDPGEHDMIEFGQRNRFLELQHGWPQARLGGFGFYT